MAEGSSARPRTSPDMQNIVNCLRNHPPARDHRDPADFSDFSEEGVHELEDDSDESGDLGGIRAFLATNSTEPFAVTSEEETDGNDESGDESDSPSNETEEYYTSSNFSDLYDSEEDFLSNNGSVYTVGEPLADAQIPFMSLLPELRAAIYAHALRRSQPILPLELCPARNVKIWASDLIPEPDKWERRRQPALLRTCRQIRKEALPVYYAVNTFYTNGSVLNAGCVYPTLRYPTPDLADSLRAIRQLRMVVTVQDNYQEEGQTYSTRLSLAIIVDLCLTRNRSDVYADIVSGTAESRRHRALKKYNFDTDLVMSDHLLFMRAKIKKYLPDVETGRHDGHSLLYAAATMNKYLKNDDPKLDWKSLLSPKRYRKPRRFPILR